MIGFASIGHAVLTLGSHLQTGRGSTGSRYPAHRSHRLNRPSPETKERSREMKPLPLAPDTPQGCVADAPALRAPLSRIQLAVAGKHSEERSAG